MFQKHIAYWVLWLLFLGLSSCQNATGPNIQKEIKHVSVTSSEVFNFQTGISGDEELAEIIQQPKNYSISSIVRDSTTNWEAVYRYKPESTFQGTVYVELKLGKGYNGQSEPRDIKLIKLNISVK